MTLVSVMVPTYNHEAYLAACLDSCLAQDLPPDKFEIVVSDDASTDGTREVVKAYQARYPDTIKALLNDRNLGVTANCNAALAACTGTYVALMAGDDLMLPGKLQKQLALMEADPRCVMCYHDLDVFDSTSGRSLHRFNAPGRQPPHEGSVGVLVQHGTFSGGCSIMLRRAACPPGGFDARIAIASDWLFWIETAVHGSIRYIPEVLGRYRRHEGNQTAVKRDASEQLVTLAIVETKYPHLAKYARRYRATYLYGRGVQAILAGDGRLGRALLVESLCQGWVSWKWAGWLGRSFL